MHGTGSGTRVVATVTDWSRVADERLWRAASLGDDDAFAAIVDRHGPAMLRYARRMLNDHGDAQEVVQDAFVAAWKGLPDFRGDAALRTWLFTLTARKAIDLRRRRRPVPVDDDLVEDLADPSAEAFGPAMYADLLQALDAALSALPWRQRASWLLREVEQMSYSEIAAVLHSTPTVVRGQLHRARAALQERLAGWR